MQSVGTFLPSTAVRSVGVLIDHPPAATPPVTTGNSHCTSLRCNFLHALLVLNSVGVNVYPGKHKGMLGLRDSWACSAAEAQCTALQGRRRRGLM